MQNNPIFQLSEIETINLMRLWILVRDKVEEQKANFVSVKLKATKAQLSKKQLWMIASILANNLEEEVIPDFVYKYLEAQP